MSLKSPFYGDKTNYLFGMSLQQSKTFEIFVLKINSKIGRKCS